eukprot:41033-Amphidinium_carterae.2
MSAASHQYPGATLGQAASNKAMHPYPRHMRYPPIADNSPISEVSHRSVGQRPPSAGAPGTIKLWGQTQELLCAQSAESPFVEPSSASALACPGFARQAQQHRSREQGDQPQRTHSQHCSGSS